MEDIILVGYGGHGKSVADTIERQNKYRIIGYTDVEQHELYYPYLGNDNVLEEYYQKGIRKAAVGIGYLGKGHIRQNIYDKLKQIGYELPIIQDPSAIVSKAAIISEGVFIGKGAIINAEARVGKLAIINTKALVEHECSVGDFTHIAVGAVLCGQVSVGNNAFIGANATVVQCCTIADDQFVDACKLIK